MHLQNTNVGILAAPVGLNLLHQPRRDKQAQIHKDPLWMNSAQLAAEFEARKGEA